MKISNLPTLALAAMTALTLNAHADKHQADVQSQDPMDHAMHQKADGSAARPTLTQGEVRAISKEKQRITLKHEAIKNLNMMGMTMTFAVKDPAMLDQVKVGDKVEFKAIKDNSKLMLVEIRGKK